MKDRTSTANMKLMLADKQGEIPARLIEERDRDIDKITNELTEVNGLMSDTLQMVRQQSSMLSSCEENVSRAEKNVTKGIDETKKAERNLKRRTCSII